MSDSKKPCGRYHPLPCGLDTECDVPGDYFNAELESSEIFAEYEEAQTEDL